MAAGTEFRSRHPFAARCISRGTMIYFVTGASGFIGKRLVRSLLTRPDATVYFLMREPSAERLAKLSRFWGTDATRAIPLEGDLTQPGLGIAPNDLDPIMSKVDHVFHLAAIYDLEADGATEMRTNIEGTRNAVLFAMAVGAKHFHHMSSIAAAGLYHGVFREDMFAEAEELEHPYFASKHESEKVVREECRIPWRIYRPGLVVGDSTSGEMDKVDGPYYFFKLIQKTRKLLPPWMPSIGFEGGRINLVPVDFVVAALIHLAHVEGEASMLPNQSLGPRCHDVLPHADAFVCSLYGNSPLCGLPTLSPPAPSIIPTVLSPLSAGL